MLSLYRGMSVGTWLRRRCNDRERKVRKWRGAKEIESCLDIEVQFGISQQLFPDEMEMKKKRKRNK